jgi:membrane protease YdiL (CAAX protease family)
MSAPGSDSGRPLHVLLAVLVTAAGVAAMVGAAVPAARQGLSVKEQIALGTLLLAAPAVAALLASPAARAAALGLPSSSRAAGLSVLLGGALWLASVGVLELQALVWPPSPEYLDLFRRLHEALAPHDALDALVSVAVIAVLPGVCEELVVRGVLLPSLLAWLQGLFGRHRPQPPDEPTPPSGLAAPVLAVFLSAAAFALMHDPYRMPFTLIVGLVFGALRLRTDSLRPSILAHATFNTVTFLVAPLVDDPSQGYTPEPGLGAICLVAGVALAIPLFRALRRETAEG